MDNRFNFSSYGYQIERELGANRAGGRITYLARHLTQKQQVVIKQFQFARSESNWTDYDAYDREIQVLQGLDHPGIPRYLDSFHTSAGFCMVQEYKQAHPLSLARSFDTDQIRQIALSMLNILVYLQSRIPSVIHRDIKPDNVLVDDQINVFLVDFGFARVGHGEVGVSSVVKGTLGFMPPEQLFNRQLTEASDLYGLGMTLICLLTGTKPDDIGNLVDISYRVSFKHLAPKLSVHWINWLEKMTEPKLKDRFANAATALAAFPTAPMRSPEVQFDQSQIRLTASRIGEQLTQAVTLCNLVPETLLEGRWEVAAHRSDPPHIPDRHIWIELNPVKFAANQMTCQITIDTRKLVAGKTFHRQLLLHTNALPKTYPIALQVQTAAVPIKAQTLPYALLLLLVVFALMMGWMIISMVVMAGTAVGAPSIIGFGALIGAAIGFECAVWVLATAGAKTGSITPAIAGVVTGAAAMAIAWQGTIVATGLAAAIVAIPGLVGGILAGIAAGYTAEKLTDEDVYKPLAIGLALLSVAVGASLGWGLVGGFLNAAVLVAVAATGIPFAVLVIYLPLQQIRLVTDYRKSERRLVKP
jgi:serine/threonine protein kinase